MEQDQNGNGVVQYRLKSLEDKFDRFIVTTQASMQSMEDKIDHLPEGMIGRREFEENRKNQGERMSYFATKDEVRVIADKLSGHNKIFMFVATGIGAALVAAFMSLIIKVT